MTVTTGTLSNANYLSSSISNCVESFHIYQFHHDDEMRYSSLSWTDDTLRRLLNIDLELEFVTRLESIFSKAGWEGDGRIQQMLLPPYCAIDNQDWFSIFVVKQTNNGTLFIASPKQLGCGAQISG